MSRAAPFILDVSRTVRLPIMPFRLEELTATVAGYHATGVPLVAREGGTLRAAGVGDDVGLFAVVPWVARAAGLDAAAALNAVLVAIVATGAALGLAGLVLLCRHAAARIFAVVGALAVALVGFRVGDVYVVPLAVSFAFAPWFLVAWRRAGTAGLVVFLLVAGVVLGWAHTVRSHAGTGALLFATVIVVADRGSAARRRALAVGAVVAGLAAAGLWTRALVDRRDAYLHATLPGYVVPEPRHPFWHSVYIGLGYTDNPFVAEYRDEVAMARVEALRPGTRFLSSAYESTLRDEVVRIAVAHPSFLAQNLSAKVGVVLFYFVIFANIGIVAAVRAPLPPRLAAALLAGAAFNTLFGILVVPILPYLSGLAAFAVLIGTFGVDAWFARRADGREAAARGEPPRATA